MRIAFDGSTLTPGRTGVGYYTEHLLQHLAAEVTRTGDELTVISNQPIDTTRPLPAHVRIYDKHRFPIRIGWMHLMAPQVLDAVRADVAHFTNGMIPLAANVSSVVTIHDMSLTFYPRCHPLRRLLLNRPLLGVAARLADAVVTVSHSARRDLLRVHGIPADRVTVLHEAAGPGFEPIADEVRRARIRLRYGLPVQFVLYVGAIEPRKNLSRLIEAFAIARARGVQHELVCVGPYGWGSRDLYTEIDRRGLQHVVHFTGYVPAEDLPVIYNLAELFVFPSLYEGFGLPVVEAMACGTPVVTANSSSLIEVAANAARTVNPLDTEELADAIVELAGDEPLRHELSRRGLVRSRDFSWARTASALLQLYRRVAGLVVPQAALTTESQPVAATGPISPGTVS
ncbi:MAG: glycosyltransferase family 4 protein [Acidobacteriota bacterium]